jgi:hypothetical protein
VIQKGVKIAAPSGKLGVLIPGMGAVSTTFMAGVEACQEKVAEPIGSLTQLGTIRLGKRTDKRVPLIKEFIPLAKIEDLVFAGWDIFNDNCYESAVKAGVLEKTLLDSVRPEIEKIKPMKAVFSQDYVKRLNGPERQNRNQQDGSCRTVDGRYRQVQSGEWLDESRHGLVRQHGNLFEGRADARHARFI